MSEVAPYVQSCSMKRVDIDKVTRFFESQVDFSTIKTSINPDRETYSQFLAQQIPEGQVLVTFIIPFGINMPVFYGALYQALNTNSQQST